MEIVWESTAGRILFHTCMPNKKRGVEFAKIFGNLV
jgi:hypothetical protein